MKYIFYGLSLLVLLQSIDGCMADKETMVPSAQVQNLEAVLQEVKKSTPLPVLFPTTIASSPAGAYYAYARSDAPKDYAYIIYVDSTKECHGAHDCNIGSVSAEPGAAIKKEFGIDRDDMDWSKRKEIKTTPLKLDQNITGTYTPGHAEADYWPAKVQWVHENVLYTIKWSTTESPQAFTQMANSAIMAGLAKKK